MLNHTNRTLSANLLGLNLGTQTLGLQASVVNVANRPCASVHPILIWALI